MRERTINKQATHIGYQEVMKSLEKRKEREGVGHLRRKAVPALHRVLGRPPLRVGREPETAVEELVLTVGPTDSPTSSRRHTRLYKRINSQKAIQRFQSSFTLWVLDLFLPLNLSATPPYPDTFLTPSGFSNLWLGGRAISTSHLPLPSSLSPAYLWFGF